MNASKKKFKIMGTLFVMAIAVAMAAGAAYPATVISANAESAMSEAAFAETANNVGIEVLADTSFNRDHLLSGHSYDTTPLSEFARRPVYGAYDLSQIRVGDIIYEEVDNSPEGGHAAIVSDISHDSYYGKYIQTIEVTPEKGVTYAFLDDIRIYEFKANICYLYSSNSAQIATAIDFCKSQLGKGYWYDTDNSPIDDDVNQPDWYSSELIHAGYKAGMGRGIMAGTTDGNHMLPHHLFDTWETETRISEGDMFLDIAIVTSGDKWTFTVTNRLECDVLLVYNSKLCFENDAKNWNLKDDVVEVTLNKRSSVTVRVKTNVFATTAAFSWVLANSKVNRRFITYAYNLSKNGSMTVKQSFIGINTNG